VRDDKLQMQEIFTFERVGVTDAGKVQGVSGPPAFRPGFWNAFA